MIEKLDCHPNNGSVENRVIRPASRRPGSWGRIPRKIKMAPAIRQPRSRGMVLWGYRKWSQTAKPSATGAKTAVILLKVRLMAATAIARITMPLPEFRVAISKRAHPIRGG